MSRGFVKYDLPIKKEGRYAITFKDYKGYIGTYDIQAGEGTGESNEPSPTMTNSGEEVKTGETITTSETPSDKQIIPQPHTTIQEEETKIVEKTVQATPSPAEKSDTHVNQSSGNVVNVSATVSRDNPGYFLIHSTGSPVTIKTSDNEDWVFEYKTDSGGVGIKVNDLMKKASEEATITNAQEKIYIKAYPYSYKTGAEITITASNTDLLELSDDAARAFGAPPRYTSTDKSTGKSATPIAGLILGLISAAWISKRRLNR